MRRRPRASIEDLRLAIDCLPAVTRRAMLEGIRDNEIIVGGYTDGNGGVCPMLAAHRAGGRTSFIYFAKAWDRFAQVGDRTRRATERELRILTTHLEASLLEDIGPAPDLTQALADHRQLVARRAQEQEHARPLQPEHARSERRRPGEPDRSRELRDRPGWAWSRLFRRLDDYERALERLQHGQEAAPDRRAREPVG